MRTLMMGCAVSALVALSPKSEARPPVRLSTTDVGTLCPIRCRVKVELGLASWYGEDWQGSPTASGECFDMNELTAAHRDLPLGTKIKVTNLRNRRSVVVRVNDRGPKVAGRLLDLSKAAAERLGFIGSGVTPVAVRVISYPRRYLTWSQPGPGPRP
jgi:rare lipoprotein A